MKLVQLALAILSASFLQFAFAQDIVVNDNLLSAMSGDPDHELDIYILLKEQMDEKDMLELKAKLDDQSRKAIVPQLIPSLQQLAKESQADLVQFLTSNGVDEASIRRYWIENIVYAKVPERLINQLIHRKDLKEIGRRTEIQWIESAQRGEKKTSSMQASNAESSLSRINAPFMWRRGYTGYGTKILIIDSGVDPFHEALDRQNAWHNRAIDEVWIGTENESFTYDCESHGTHVIGTSIGLARDNEDTIGVAFNAEWMAGNPIGCNVGFPQNTILEMFQWALNPDGNANTTDDVPDVINNSWGDFSLGFCSSLYRNSLSVLENAGIAVIFSAGNSGPGDRTVSPPGNLEINPVNPMTVGALNPNNTIADFSSRGPSRCRVNGSTPIKPELCAPGVDVRSSLPNNRYREQQGTSMASPHVSGACLLLMEAFPRLSARTIKEALYFTAIDIGAPGEDNETGRGRIDLERAYNYLINEGNTPVDVAVNNDVELWNVVLNQFGCDTDISADVQIYNGGRSPVTAVDIEFILEGTNLRKRTSWTGTLLPGASTWFTLDPMDADAGFYDAIVQIVNVNNNGKDDRTLNDQMKRQVNLRSTNNYELAVDENFGDLCAGSRALITVSGADDADQYNWYDDFLRESRIGEGRSFTPELQTGSNQFFVEPEYTENVGMELPEESALNYGYSGGRLQFDALQPFRLNALDIMSNGSGSVGFIIRRGRDTVFQTSGYFAFEGQQTLPINRIIPAGRGYEIFLFDNPGLAYAVEGVQFPYEVDNVISFTGSSPPFNGESPFYYFFNWDIEYIHPCGYKSIDVEVDGTGPVPEADFSVNSTELELPGNAELVTNNQSRDANAYQWTFGDGSISNEASPRHSYFLSGTYDVGLIARNNSGCTDATVIQIEVKNSTSSDEPETSIMDLQLYPNPFYDQIVIEYPGEIDLQEGQLRVVNSLGQLMIETPAQPRLKRQIIDTNGWPGGIYFLEYKYQGGKQSVKLLKP